jgi:hypothetical protein
MRTHILVPATFLCASVLANAQNIFSIAGLGYSHRDNIEGKAALNAPLSSVYGLLFDRRAGRLLFHDQTLVMRLEPDGSVLTVAGLGLFEDGDTSDGTLASFLRVALLRGMAQDSTGALYLSDAVAHRVYRIGLDGTVSTFAGGGPQPPGFQRDGGPATAAAFESPRGLVFDFQREPQYSRGLLQLHPKSFPRWNHFYALDAAPYAGCNTLAPGRCRGLDDRLL